MDIRCLVNAHNIVGESPLWHPDQNSVYWTDINGFQILRYNLDTGEVRVWEFGEVVCALSLTTDPERLLVGLGSRVILWNSDCDECIELCRPEPDWPLNRLNDGATDPNGFFWIGSMRNNVTPDGAHREISGRHGSLYRVAPDGTVTRWDGQFGITNTLAWSPDGATFYCGCSMSNVIYAYDFDVRDSSVGNRRVFVSGPPQGVPDGSAMDAEGYLWNCRYSGASILRISPQGEIDRVIRMPVTNITNCCFGGPDLRTLFVTTAASEAGEEQDSGGLFAIPMEVAGIPAGIFRCSVERLTGNDPRECRSAGQVCAS